MFKGFFQSCLIFFRIKRIVTGCNFKWNASFTDDRLCKKIDGNIYPDESIISKDLEYWPLNQKISDTMEVWREKLSKDDYLALEELLDIRFQIDHMHSASSFMYGFKLGTMIMLIEALRRLLVRKSP
ncbi:DUF6809 family protein [Lutispora sp.]|nr:DUF6809 family protein [Lutispora sp.]MEA4961441.1 hypothetical protein [Lutispora sp.]